MIGSLHDYRDRDYRDRDYNNSTVSGPITFFTLTIRHYATESAMVFCAGIPWIHNFISLFTLNNLDCLLNIYQPLKPIDNITIFPEYTFPGYVNTNKCQYILFCGTMQIPDGYSDSKKQLI